MDRSTLLLLLLQPLICIVARGILAQNPCETAQRFVVGEERDPSYVTDGVPLCDTVPEQWYRVTGPEEIDVDVVQVAPARGRCGTEYPMWINGTLPTGGSQKEVTVCIVGLLSPCTTQVSIGVKDCGFFRSYRLSPPAACPSAYCFDVSDPPVPTPDPTCPSDVVSIDEVPIVIPLVADSNDPELSMPPLILEELQFQCDFTSLRHDLFYDVKWFINGIKLAFEKQAVPGHDMASSVLREQHWRRRFKMGMQIACSVSGRTHSNCNSGPERRSEDFFAGIRVSPTTLNMETDLPQTVTYTCTVPIPCYHEPGQPAETCHVQLDASGRNSDIGCPVGDSIEAVQTTCGVTFSSLNWQTVQTLQISATYDSTTDDHNSLVSLRAMGRWTDTIPDIWLNVAVPAVTVYIRDQDSQVSNTRCTVISDPYFRTFDNYRRFYTSNTQGEFLIFRHNSFPIAVHTLQERCSDRTSTTCTCGVAIQSGQDVLTWVGCGNVYNMYKQFRMKSLGCFKSEIRVEEITDGRVYMIHLPIGMRVGLTLRQVSTWRFLNIDIFATPDLRNIVDGLCGNMDGDPSNDVINTDRVNRYRVRRADSLFFGSLRTDWLYSSVCTCHTSEDDDTGEMTRNVTCSNRKTTSTCSVPGKDVTEVYSERCRQKRDLSLHDLDEDWPDFNLDEDYVPPPPVWKNGWSLQSATQYCTDYIHNSEVYKRCNGLSDVSPDPSVFLCVDMIHVTGNTSWSEATLDAYKADCQQQVSRNSSLWSSDNGQQSVFDSVMSVMCSDNCNGRGTCVQGVCKCNNGYRGADCGLDTNKPPKELIFQQFGLCDLSQKLCQQTLVFGSGFIDLGKFGYRADVVQVRKHNIVQTGMVKMRPGIVHSRNEARLTFDPIDMSSGLKDLDSPSVVGYRISLTNNGQDYGGEAIFLPYDSTCFSCSVIASQTSCEIKVGYCSIGFKCVAAGKTHEGNNCYVCNPDISQVSWSAEGCHDPTKVKVLVIALTVPCLIMITAVFIVIVVKRSGCVSRRLGQSRTNVKNSQKPPPPYSGPQCVSRPKEVLMNSWTSIKTSPPSYVMPAVN